MRPIRIVGHSGWGDGLHQRAALRKLIEQGHEVWLETPSPCLYHDLPINLLPNKTTLRTQQKNMEREWERYGNPPAVPVWRDITAFYNGLTVQEAGSVCAAIARVFGVDDENLDFSLPVPDEWIEEAKILVPEPFIFYRPPIARHEWGGAGPRNPDPDAYAQIFQAIRGNLAVVSVADLEDGQEWIVGNGEKADYVFHYGELTFKDIAALVKRSQFVYTTPGVMTVLGQAVETPTISVFGGYERAASFSAGRGPWLALEADNPCGCWKPGHDCDKRMDVTTAIARVREFLKGLG